MFVNGRMVGSASQTAVMQNTASVIQIGAATGNNTNRYWDGLISNVGFWTGIQPYAKARTLSENPWQIFQPINRIIFAPASGSSAITGSSTITLGALSSTATALLKIAGSSAITLGELTASTAGKLEIRGSSAITLGALTAHATGSSQQSITGTANIVLGELTVNAIGGQPLILPPANPIRIQHASRRRFGRIEYANGFRRIGWPSVRE